MHLMPFLPLFCMGHKDWCFHHNTEMSNTKAKEIPFSCFELECGIEEKGRSVLRVHLHISKKIIFSLQRRFKIN